MDPRLKLAMIMLFFQAVQLKNKAVQLVILELERVHQERGRNRRLELVAMVVTIESKVTINGKFYATVCPGRKLEETKT